MQAIERTVTVDQPLEKVWNFLSDFTTTEQWDPPTTSTVREPGDGGVGTVYRNRSKLVGREVEILYMVVDCDPGRCLQLRGETSAMTMLDTMTFEGGEASTTVTYRAEFQPQGGARLVEPILPLGLKRLGDKSQDQLKATLADL